LKKGRENVVLLLSAVLADPFNTRLHILEEFSLKGQAISEMYAMMIFVSDDYFRIKTSNQLTPHSDSSSKAIQFWKIAIQLPLDLQMILGHRMYKSAANFILSQDSEPAFKRMARFLKGHGPEIKNQEEDKKCVIM